MDARELQKAHSIALKNRDRHGDIGTLSDGFLESVLQRSRLEQEIRTLKISLKEVRKVKEEFRELLKNAPLNDAQFRALLNLMMVSDPWPLSGTDSFLLETLATDEARRRNYKDWIEAYHKHLKDKVPAQAIPEAIIPSPDMEKFEEDHGAVNLLKIAVSIINRALVMKEVISRNELTEYLINEMEDFRKEHPIPIGKMEKKPHWLGETYTKIVCPLCRKKTTHHTYGQPVTFACAECGMIHVGLLEEKGKPEIDYKKTKHSFVTAGGDSSGKCGVCGFPEKSEIHVLGS